MQQPPQQQPPWKAAGVGRFCSRKEASHVTLQAPLALTLPAARARAEGTAQRRARSPLNAPAAVTPLQALPRTPPRRWALRRGRHCMGRRCCAAQHGADVAWACGGRPRRLTRAPWCRRAWRGWRSGSARTRCAGGRPACWSTRSCRWPTPPARRPSCARVGHAGILVRFQG